MVFYDIGDEPKWDRYLMFILCLIISTSRSQVDSKFLLTENSQWSVQAKLWLDDRS